MFCNSKWIQFTVCLEWCVSVVEICEFRNCIKLVTAGSESIRFRLWLCLAVTLLFLSQQPSPSNVMCSTLLRIKEVLVWCISLDMCSPGLGLCDFSQFLLRNARIVAQNRTWLLPSSSVIIILCYVIWSAGSVSTSTADKSAAFHFVLEFPHSHNQLHGVWEQRSTRHSMHKLACASFGFFRGVNYVSTILVYDASSCSRRVDSTLTYASRS